MNCMDAQRKIRVFLDGTMDRGEQKKFLEHVCSCKKCMDEVKTEFYFSKGLALFDSDSDFDDIDIEKELDEKLYMEETISKRTKHIRTGILLATVFAVCLLQLVGSY